MRFKTIYENMVEVWGLKQVKETIEESLKNYLENHTIPSSEDAVNLVR